MASRLLVSEKSAMPNQTKRSILINEGLRRIRSNCLQGSFENNINTLKEFNLHMLKIGHKQKFRLEVTQAIVTKYQLQLDNHEKQVTPFYRNKTERKSLKAAHKIHYKTKVKWHKKMGYNSVLNIPQHLVAR